MSAGRSAPASTIYTTATATPTSCEHRYHEVAGVRLDLQSTPPLQCSSVRATSVNRHPSRTSAECRCTGHTLVLSPRDLVRPVGWFNGTFNTE